MKKCNRCKEFYEKNPLKNGEHIINEHYKMSPVKCAFPNGVFSWDNWNCETVNILRTLAGEDDKDREYFHAYHRDDMRSASIGVLIIPGEDTEEDDGTQQGYLIMTWYKSRGATGQAYVMCDDIKPEPLTLKTAEFIIRNFLSMPVK